ncbi:hypothetical protein [Yersinia vastinensis]|uniref:hypothetical protein n=1 Tax=Yersinia vastinensis TaxID=2890318 RepID=UPI0011AB2C3F|nr:hypothetical protein [Yersinia vastinensis]
MLLGKKCFLFLFLFLFIWKGYPSEEGINGVWEFYKVSNMDVYGEHDSDTFHNLNAIYKQVEVKVDDRFLTIRNPLLNSKDVCSIEYREIKQTPILYFHSDTTVSLYSKLFSQEGIELEKNISVLTASEQSEVCPSIYNEIIKNDDYLVLIDHYYIVFFRKATANLLTQKDNNDGFLDYCKNANVSDVFDGDDKYTCEFVKMDINNAYTKIRDISTNAKLMKKTLLMGDLKYSIKDGMISHQWKGQNVLKVIISYGNEITTYEFHEKKSGTSLEITVETGY